MNQMMDDGSNDGSIKDRIMGIMAQIMDQIIVK